MSLLIPIPSYGMCVLCVHKMRCRREETCQLREDGRGGGQKSCSAAVAVREPVGADGGNSWIILQRSTKSSDQSQSFGTNEQLASVLRTYRALLLLLYAYAAEGRGWSKSCHEANTLIYTRYKVRWTFLTRSLSRINTTTTKRRWRHGVFEIGCVRAERYTHSSFKRWTCWLSEREKLPTSVKTPPGSKRRRRRNRRRRERKEGNGMKRIWWV